MTHNPAPDARPYPLWTLAPVLATASVVVILTMHGPLREIATAVVVAGPGLVSARIIGGPREIKLLIAVLVSLSVTVCVAQAVTYAAGFSWKPCLWILLTVTWILSAICAVPSRQRTDETPHG